MHRLRSKSTVHRFRFAALLICLKCLLAPTSAGILVYSFIINDDRLTMIGLSLVLATVVIGITQWFVSARTNCPLCMTTVLAEKKCTKHRLARTVFGSHRLQVALSILFQNSFRCPYCHEPTAMQARPQSRR